MLQMLNAISRIGLGFGISSAVIVILLLVICYKNWPDETKMFLKVSICILIFAVVPCFAVYCGVEANIYYGSEGGIFGQLKNSWNSNIGKVSTDTFEISELNLRLDENQEYSATIRVDLDTFESKLILNPNKKYSLFVNNALTSDNFMKVTGESIAISANYTYLFNDFQKNEIGSDTLHILFNFNKNDIVCRVSSAGDSTMRDLWGLYYRKNGMKIKFVETNYTKPSINDEGEGDVSDLCSLVFDDGENSVIKVCKVNSIFSDIPTFSKVGYKFEGWSIDGVNVFDFSKPITENLEFTPLLTEYVEKEWVTYTAEGHMGPVIGALAISSAEEVEKYKFSGSADFQYHIDTDFVTEFTDIEIMVGEALFQSYAGDNFGGVDGTNYAINSYLELVKGANIYCNHWMKVGDSIQIVFEGEEHYFTFERVMVVSGKSIELEFSFTNMKYKVFKPYFVQIAGVRMEVPKI